MRLIVTRPAEDAAPLCRWLAAAGHEPILSPLLEIRPVADLSMPARDYQAVLITSANGARALAGRPEMERLKPLHVLAVGRASAEAAREAGFGQVEEAGGDVAALARMALETLSPQEGPLLYVSGAVATGDLASTLAAAGFDVDRVIAYEARAAEALPEPCAAALEAGRAEGVLLYSPRTARIWVSLVEAAGLAPAAARVVHYCLSGNVAAAVRDGIADDVPLQVASRPDEFALLEMIPPPRMRAGSRGRAPLMSPRETQSLDRNWRMAAKGSKRGRGKATLPEAEPTTSPEAALPTDEERPGEGVSHGLADEPAQPSRPELEPIPDSVEGPDPTRPGRPESAAWPVSQLVVGGLAIVIALAALAGILVFATGGDGTRIAQHAQRLDALASESESQASRIETVERAVSGLQSELGEVTAALGDIRSLAEQNGQAIEELRNTVNVPAEDTATGEAVGELQNAIDSLDQRLAGLEQAGDVEDLTGRIGRLEEEVAGLREQAAAQAEATGALGRAHAALAAQVAAGARFAEELEAVAAELPNAPGLEALRPHAAEGVATLEDLQARLAEIAGNLPEEEGAEPAAADGVWETMRERIEGMVTVRRADEAALPDALARAREALQGGNLEAAIAEVEQVSDSSPDLEAWLADARARQEAQAGLDELSDAVLRQFAGRQ